MSKQSKALAVKDEEVDSSLYELVLFTKQHEEERRDEINKYYTSLFAAGVSVMPVIEKFIDSKPVIMSMEALDSPLPTQLLSGSIKTAVVIILLALVGVIAACSWILTLKRIYNYIEAFDSLLSKLEERMGISFINFTSNYLQDVQSPGRVTKQTMLLPITFIVIFMANLLYNIAYIAFIMRWVQF